MSDPTTLPDTVLRHFPGQAKAVEALAAVNPDFRDMCDELDAAETALSRLDAVVAQQRAARRQECQDWIRRLLCEMGQALMAANVVPLRPHGAGLRP